MLVSLQAKIFDLLKTAKKDTIFYKMHNIFDGQGDMGSLLPSLWTSRLGSQIAVTEKADSRKR
jgi:hypothetical protein